MSFLGDIFGSNVSKGSNPGFANAAQVSAEGRGGLTEDIANQADLVDMLKKQAAGQGPSVAGAQTQAALQQQTANNNAMAAGARGVNPGMALRGAMNANNNAAQQASQQGMIGRMQEQMNAQHQLGGQLNTMLGQGLQSQQANQGVNAGLAAQNAQQQGSLMGGLIGGASSALPMMAMGAAHGGRIPHMAGGGFYPDFGNTGSFGAGMAAATGKKGASSGAGGGGSDKTANYSEPAPLSESSGFADVDKEAYGGPINFKPGGHVPGQAKVAGDSEENDTVPAMLSPGEIVVPRSKAKDPQMAKEFIEHLMKGGKAGAQSGADGFGKVLEAHRTLEKRVAQLEKMRKKT